MRAAPVAILTLAGAALCAVLVGSFLTSGSGDDQSADRYVLLPTASGATAEAPLASATPTGFGPTAGREFAAAIDFVPARGRWNRQGFAIGPRSDPASLAAYDLRPGDIVYDVDGDTLNRHRIAALGAELGMLDAVEITFERKGEVRNRLVVFR